MRRGYPRPHDDDVDSPVIIRVDWPRSIEPGRWMNLYDEDVHHAFAAHGAEQEVVREYWLYPRAAASLHPASP